MMLNNFIGLSAYITTNCCAIGLHKIHSPDNLYRKIGKSYALQVVNEKVQNLKMKEQHLE